MKNLIEEEIKGRLSSGNACYHSVHNLLSSSLLSKNVKIRTYKTIFCKWSLTLREEHRLSVSEPGAEENIWNEERLSGRRLERIA
jgi:hypothetical protein